jgi:hypothetical protein
MAVRSNPLRSQPSVPPADTKFIVLSGQHISKALAQLAEERRAAHLEVPQAIGFVNAKVLTRLRAASLVGWTPLGMSGGGSGRCVGRVRRGAGPLWAMQWHGHTGSPRAAWGRTTRAPSSSGCCARATGRWRRGR